MVSLFIDIFEIIPPIIAKMRIIQKIENDKANAFSGITPTSDKMPTKVPSLIPIPPMLSGNKIAKDKIAAIQHQSAKDTFIPNACDKITFTVILIS